ncbi:hypothetical protein C7974DRAFT_62551 [Boeremia exigua]|uniref:uncharacterized protein n=1 Tax=Boeremia exigua TaxID=749465 RepID=UPI001E8E6EFB|nr:uncharacterized protein C7974DRAFT_62551 [Boeremia exigua]KAH6615297.1 hypothetical protein C7974DRAFT_62551 [Boeremia exigua]
MFRKAPQLRHREYMGVDDMNFWYEPSGTDLLVRQPAYEEEFLSTEPHGSYRLSKKAGRHYSQPQHANSQHWNGNNPSRLTQPIPTQYSSTSTLAEGFTYADPGLSSHNTSRRSSINPPFTPDTSDNISSSTRQRFLSPNDAVYSNEYLVPPSDRVGGLGHFDSRTTIDQSLRGLDFSVPSNGLEVTTVTDSWLGTSQEQAWEDPLLVVSELGSQQAIAAPPHWPAPKNRSRQHVDTLGVTWQMNEDLTWTPCDDEFTPTLDAFDAAYGGSGGTDAFDEPDNTACKAKTSSATKAVYPPAQCEVCGKAYTGRYGTGNMQRHFRLEHVNESRKEYPCLVCKNTYHRSDALRNHERLKHPRLQRAVAIPRSRS